MEEVKVSVIGAGVVGLAVTAELARYYRDVCLLEKNESFGLETSSRSSEVIHAGIYYPPGSLKAKLCLEGNHACYELCAAHHIEHKRLGKLIISTNAQEMEELEHLFENGKLNGVPLEFLSKQQVNKLEPEVRASCTLFSPSTGIIDAYALMRYFFLRAKEQNAYIAFKTRVVSIELVSAGYKVVVEDPSGCYFFLTKVLVNCAGLSADRIAEMAGIDPLKAGYRLHYCKGEYFRTSKRLTNMLVYPVPLADENGLGIHFTPNLQGTVRLGPNSRYVNDIDYSVDEGGRQEFYTAASRMIPSLEIDDLEPDFAGIRPTLRGKGEGFRDFIIKHEGDRGLPGLINLVGIESPGLTASPAIASYVRGMVSELL